jgi:uncharacterized protein YdeI (YjbR/CyaY-like superfamily)
MGKKDKRIDAYIEKARPFAKPILKHIRKLVHQGNSDVEETIKWGMPCFDYKGPFFHMASFKQHAVCGFWKAALLKDAKGYLKPRSVDGGDAMGHMGKLTSIKDLPPDKVLLDFIKQATKLNDEGIKVPAKPKPDKKELIVPDYYIAALKKNKKAFSTFEKFSYSDKKEYVEWITEAKTEATRDSRIKTSIEWMSEGKSRNWKYKN